MKSPVGVTSIKRLVSTLVLIAVTFAGMYADVSDIDVRRLEKLSSEALLRKADSNMDKDTMTDVTLVCLNIVVRRYYRDPDDSSSIRAAIRAMRNLGNLYMSRDFDFMQAYNNLEMARQMAEDYGVDEELPYVLNSIVNLYNITSSSKEHKMEIIIPTLCQAYDKAVKTGNIEAQALTVINMSLIAMSNKEWRGMKQYVDKFLSSGKSAVSGSIPQFAVYFAKGARAAIEGNTDLAIAQLQLAHDCPVEGKFQERFKLVTSRALSNIFMSSGEYASAKSLLLADLELAEKENYDDFLLHTYAALTNLYELTENPDSSEYYYVKYLKHKENLNVKAKLNKIGEEDFAQKMERVSREVRDLSLKRRQDQRRIIIVSVISLALVLLLLMMIYMHRRLKRNNNLLFSQNSDMLRREQEHLLMKETWEKEKVEMSAQLKEARQSETDPPTSKYTGSTLSEVDSRDLYLKTVSFMESSPDIYQQDFSMKALAERIGASYHHVSQAINEHSGGNFSQLLNSYRIREVCRRMRSTQGEQYTIESLAESVGFKSRTSFARLFKAVMGMTASEYMKLAREDKSRQ